MNTKSVPDFILEITNKIANSLSPESVILFGSYAYGKTTQNSDLDILVIMNTELNAASRNRLVSRLINPRPIPMDIIVKTPTEISILQKKVDPFINEVLNKGFVLYAKQ